jgi:hypothetical protein
MPRRRHRAPASRGETLDWPHARCDSCHGPLWIAYHDHRTVVTLDGPLRLTLRIRRCINRACARYHRPCRPTEEGHFALPTDDPQVRERLRAQGRVVLAIDGLQPDVGHEVLWILRDCPSGEILLARSLLSATETDLSALLREVEEGLPVPITGVISDGQQSLRRAIAAVLPDVPHQLCQFHYLREAALPIFEADRHAKKELKKLVRDIRPIERRLEGRDDDDTAATHGYCQAVRSALTDDGRPPLAASGLKLADRIAAIHDSIASVGAKRGCPPTSPASTGS